MEDSLRMTVLDGVDYLDEDAANQVVVVEIPVYADEQSPG